MVTLQNVTSFIKDNIGTIGAGVGGVALGGVLGYTTAKLVSSRKASKKRKSKNSYKRKRNY